VVASVFAFTILSAGTFSTEKSREAVYGGLEQVGASMEVYGSVIGEASSAGATNVLTVSFTLAAVQGGGSVNITDTTSSENEVVISYRDDDESKTELSWSVAFIGTNDGDWLLEEGELAEITISISETNSLTLQANDEFMVEVKPPQGGVVPVMRTVPASLDKVMVLN
jgi:flagellin FlaB